MHNSIKKVSKQMVGKMPEVMTIDYVSVFPVCCAVSTCLALCASVQQFENRSMKEMERKDEYWETKWKIWQLTSLLLISFFVDSVGNKR